ncbi:hypothetical protein [Pedobacter antarcticus]|uniref:hypothetical protein n=1 Tax=Pedobacter antarcticus TaxID=34086 RepID=UPI00292F3674|nr:hypothetical protein [Pedobacter antarcticus]
MNLVMFKIFSIDVKVHYEKLVKEIDNYTKDIEELSMSDLDKKDKIENVVQDLSKFPY